jgi:hypothetical protein
VTVTYGALHGLDEVRRGHKAEGNWIPDIEVADFSAGSLNLARLRDDVPNRVIEAAHAAGDRNCGGRAHRKILSERPDVKTMRP